MDDLIDLITLNQQSENFIDLMDIIERNDKDCDGFFDIQEFTDTMLMLKFYRKNLITKNLPSFKNLLHLEPSERTTEKIKEVFNALRFTNVLDPVQILKPDLIELVETPRMFP